MSCLGPVAEKQSRVTRKAILHAQRKSKLDSLNLYLVLTHVQLTQARSAMSYIEFHRIIFNSSIVNLISISYSTHYKRDSF